MDGRQTYSTRAPCHSDTQDASPQQLRLFCFCGYAILSISCQASDCSSGRPLKTAPLQGPSLHVPREEKWIGMGWCAWRVSVQLPVWKLSVSGKRDAGQMLRNEQDRYNSGALLKEGKRRGMTPYTFSHPFTVVACTHVRLMGYISLRRRCLAPCRDRWLTHYRISHFYWHILSRNISSMGIGSLAKVTHLSWKARKRKRWGGERIWNSIRCVACNGYA